MVKYKYLNVETKAGMQKRVGWEMETIGWKVGGLALYDGLFYIQQFYQTTDISLLFSLASLNNCVRTPVCSMHLLKPDASSFCTFVSRYCLASVQFVSRLVTEEKNILHSALKSDIVWNCCRLGVPLSTQNTLPPSASTQESRLSSMSCKATSTAVLVVWPLFVNLYVVPLKPFVLLLALLQFASRVF